MPNVRELSAPPACPGGTGLTSPRPWRSSVVFPRLSKTTRAREPSANPSTGVAWGGVTPIDTLIYIKAGSAIGGAYLVDGTPLVGQGGLAGDISHIPIEAAAGRPCKCGNVGCLETIASADSIRADLAASGLVYENNAQLLAAARGGVPEVATAIRQAGTLLGLSVAHLVSFLAPQGVIVGGALSAVDAFSAGVRAALHQSCLPSIMENLVIESSRSGRDAALWGLSSLTPHKISKENRS